MNANRVYSIEFVQQTLKLARYENRKMVDVVKSLTVPKSPIAGAIGYALNKWEALVPISVFASSRLFVTY